MSYSQISSSLSSVATSLITAITNFLAGVANFIAQNADLFATIVGIGIIVGLILKFGTSLPFIGNFLNYVGLA
ncbi:conserved lipothrixviral protein [Sulfolobus islandicus filamentous virus 2]|uniref:Conserved lipothrixviral protein n=1 Tax=Sulfolobus islandicus filamentous virus 2 TaxID=1902331 RepID=A0A1D8BJ95_SIFV|nr:conserved lipothrixviral protein [Sulfolobus islandicus filamentous virus 2]